MSKNTSTNESLVIKHEMHVYEIHDWLLYGCRKISDSWKNWLQLPDWLGMSYSTISIKPF